MRRGTLNTAVAPGPVGLVHDYLLVLRGAERAFAAITDCWPEAPIYTLLYDERGTKGRFRGRSIHTSRLQQLRVRQAGFRRLLPLFPPAVERLAVDGHRLVISSTSAFAHGVRLDPDVVHVAYCHTPFRYAWHEREQALAETAASLRPLVRRTLDRVREWDIEASRRVTHYIAVSELTRQRIQDFYGRDATIVHPPVEVHRLSIGEPEDFFLVVTEVVPHKRVANALEAARLARRPIKVVGGGRDLPRLKREYGATATFLGRVSDQELEDLYRRACALVVPNIEEFGIAAVEAQASGRPVLAADAGGVRETVIPGETGVLVPPDDIKVLADAMRETDWSAFSPERIRNQAMRFSTDAFKRRFTAEIERLTGSDGRELAAEPAPAPSRAGPSRPRLRRREPRIGADTRPLHIQLWSYNYDPEPTGIGPISTVLAKRLRERGHRLDVVAAHPHYPSPEWGIRWAPYREVRDGIPVLRLPLWVGRASATERYRQELTYVSSLFASLPFLGRPDIVVSASPSFPALLPAMLNTRLRGLPWLVWIHDLLPDGAAATGLIDDGTVLRLARRLERSAYREADLIVVLSRVFGGNLVGKGVPEEKIRLIYDPATRRPRALEHAPEDGVVRVLSMGNIGFSQGLGSLIEAFEQSDDGGARQARLIITGSGVAEDEVREKIVSDRVQMLGVVNDDRLERELQRATIALVSQHHQGAEFNIPSKLMNFMAYGLPILAVVHPEGEVARLVDEAGAGWVLDSSRPEQFPAKLAELSERPAEVVERGRAAARYAERHFTQDRFAEEFEAALREAVARAQARVRSGRAR